VFSGRSGVAPDDPFLGLSSSSLFHSLSVGEELAGEVSVGKVEIVGAGKSGWLPSAGSTGINKLARLP
jgi:hypothetical protein